MNVSMYISEKKINLNLAKLISNILQRLLNIEHYRNLLHSISEPEKKCSTCVRLEVPYAASDTLEFL